MDKRRRKLFMLWHRIILGVFLAVACMLILEFEIQSRGNKRTAENTSQMLLDQVINVLDKNDIEEEELLASLKEDYIVRAKAVAYMIDHNRDQSLHAEDYVQMAELMSVDEIHLFNKDGEIYNGSNPEYYGLSFDSGEQMRYFMPMLKHKTLSMCQDVTPNTAEGKNMMYAITWNDSGTKMIQVGVEPVRLLEQLKQNQIDIVIDDMPTYEGYEFCVADKDSGEIKGATDDFKIGKTYDEIGFPVPDADLSEAYRTIYRVDGVKYYCVYQEYDEYVVSVIFCANTFKRNTMISLAVVLIYLMLAAVVIFFMVYKLLRSNKQRDRQMSILESMSEIYYAMRYIDLNNNYAIIYSQPNQQQKKFDKQIDARKMMREIVEETVIPDYVDAGYAYTDLNTLPQRMKGKKMISMEFITKQVGWIRMSFIALETDKNEVPTSVICTTLIIDKEKRKEESLVKQSNTDELTGCYNRRAYEEAMSAYTEEAPNETFIYVSMDINGLKHTNDTMGHAAGDELIRGASWCMLECFGSYGRVYRIGGDEFAALIFASEDRLKEIRLDFEDVISQWSGDLIKALSVSCGYVLRAQEPDATIRQLAVIADQRMYEQKKSYYKKKNAE